MNSMMLLPGLHLVGSGSAGFDLSDPLDCHVYLVEGTTSWAVIDAGGGGDSQRIIENITSVAKASDLNLAAPGVLLLTHAHADHSGGTADILAAFPSLTARAGTAAAEWVTNGDLVGMSLDRGKASGAYPLDYTYRGTAPVQSIRDNDVVELGGRRLTAIASPGHADGHICFLLEDDLLDAATVLFSGDCVFTRGRISLQNLHDVNIPRYAATLARLASFDVDALLPGHYSVSLADAGRHIRAAHAAFAAGGVPPNAP